MQGRDLRFEILRVCAILFVTAHHVLLFGADLCGYLSPFCPDVSGVAGIALNSLFVTGVSLFVMISGWFGIRRVWQPCLRLILECAAFGAAALLLSVWLHGLFPIPHTDDTLSLARLWQSMKFTNWWFVVHYLLLVLAAPLLERALYGADRSAVERILLCLFVFDFLFGFVWGYVTPNGYNVVHFVMLYVLARYMRLFPESAANRFVRRWAWTIVGACVLLMTAWFLFDKASWHPGHNPMTWNYNCPLVVLEAMALFALFQKAGGRAKPLALFAPYVLGIYLLQSSPLLIYFRNALGGRLFSSLGYVGFVCTVLLLFVICGALSMIVMKVLRKVERALSLR